MKNNRYLVGASLFLVFSISFWTSSTVFSKIFNYRQQLALVTSSTGVAYYVDNQNGSDDGAGTSSTSSWRTIAKINATKFNPGDKILFKRGGVWREELKISSSGSSDNPIIVDAYGDGAKPLILGSENVSTMTTKGFAFRKSGTTNIWTTGPISIAKDFNNTNIGFVLLTKEVSSPVWGVNVGKVVNSVANLTTDGTFYWKVLEKDAKGNPIKGELLMYSTNSAGPFVQWPDLEIALRARGITIDNQSYLTIKNVDVRYGSSGSIRIANGSHHIILDNCEASYGGGTLTAASFSGGSLIRAGDLIKIDTNSHDITVKNCRVTNSWESGISVEAWASNDYLYNISIEDNEINRCSLGIGVNAPDYSGVSNNSVEKVYLRRNKITGSGYGWIPPAYTSHGQGIWLYQNDKESLNSKVANIYVEGNIINGFTANGLALIGGGPYYISRNMIKNGETLYGDKYQNNAILIHGGGASENYGDVVADIFYNVIANNSARGFLAINNNPASGAVSLKNNVFYNNGKSNSDYPNVYILNSYHQNLLNNIIVSQNSYILSISVAPFDNTNNEIIKSDNNLLWSMSAGVLARARGINYTDLASYQKALSLDKNSLSADPLFVSAGSDFHLKENSPAIDKGTSVNLTSDFVGNILVDLPDIGAYEFIKPKVCVENWVCGDWSVCSNNNQSRTCQDKNLCGTQTSRPSENQACTTGTSDTINTTVTNITSVTSTTVDTKNNLPILISYKINRVGVRSGSFSAQVKDLDNDPLVYTWNFGDGSTGTGESVVHQYTKAGFYSVSLVVSDGKGSQTFGPKTIYAW